MMILRKWLETITQPLSKMDNTFMDVSKWKEYRIGDLFTIVNGIKYPSYDRISGSLPLISTTDQNNGISDYIAPREEVFSNILTVAYSGNVGATFYHEGPVFVGETVFALVPKFPMTKNIGLFFCVILRKHNKVYDYGRKIIGSRYVDDLIKIPDKNGRPDFDYMESYIKNISDRTDKNGLRMDECLKTANKSQPVKYSDSNWKDFLLKDIVYIDYGNKFDLQDMTFDNPTVNFISRTSNNNGLSSIVDKIQNKEPYPAGCLTVALGGSIGSTFYQSKPFYTGQNLAVIQFDKDISIYAKLFLATIIQFEVKDKFIAFGRELNRHIKTDFQVRLPADANGKPNWKQMEEYIKSLPYSDRI